MNNQLQPLLSFKDQFTYDPSIVTTADTQQTSYESAVVCGMGGSAIAVSFLKLIFPELPVSLHNTYGLPKNITTTTLIILNSYSGNTEEVIDSFMQGQKNHCHLAVITQGGELLTLAQKNNTPHIILPNTGFEPRFAIGQQMLAILRLMGEESKIDTLKKAALHLSTEETLTSATHLSERFTSTYPILLSSSHLTPLTYPIKAAINEGAKVPSFINTIPEANHNEWQSFVVNETVNEKDSFSFIFFVSPFDHERIQKRISVMQSMLREQGFICEEIRVDSASPSALIEALFFGYAFATSLAIARNVEPYSTPFIQTFKKRMRS